MDDCHKSYILKDVAHLWRTWKSRVTRDLNEAIENGLQEDVVNQKIKPSEVDPNQWAEFRRQRSSQSFKEKSKKFKELRAKQTLQHTTSRKGYARLEEEMASLFYLYFISLISLFLCNNFFYYYFFFI